MKVEEFKALIFPLNRKLFAFSGKMLVNASEAEDLIQEIYIKLWQKRDNLYTYNNLEAFVTTMVRNLCLDKIKARRMISMDDHPEKYESIESDPGPQRQLEIKDSFAEIKRALDKLPEKQRIILQLKDFQGFTTEEIIKTLNMTPNSFRVNLSRARKTIRESLVKKMQYGTQKN
jgi:RNA polymerase sigma-70 factor (ECF subfamily)